MRQFYVYIYMGADGVPYYVGKGQGKRFMRWHSYVDVPPDWNNIWMIRDLTEKKAYDIEIALIAGIGRKCTNEGPLENLAPGGPSSKSGWYHSEETKRKIAGAFIGVPKTEEHKAKMRKPKSKTHREAIRKANLGRKDDGRSKKISETLRSKKWFNNGHEQVFCKPENKPDGYVYGRIGWNVEDRY
jgi:hypothetical protein